jgi:hypothetical protein
MQADPTPRPRRVRIILPCAYVRLREEAGAAAPSRATASDSLPAPSPPALGAVPRGKDAAATAADAKGLIVEGLRAGDSGGGDRLIFVPPEWEQRG